jgi:hypothetical protein
VTQIVQLSHSTELVFTPSITWHTSLVTIRSEHRIRALSMKILSPLLLTVMMVLAIMLNDALSVRADEYAVILYRK